MPIETDTPHGQIFDQLARKLFRGQARFDRLASYHEGDPPLPERLQNLKSIAQDFFKTSRTNFAELVTEAPRERMKPTGVRTAAVASQDEDGDEDAWAKWTGAGLNITAADVHNKMLSLGDAYVIVSMSDDGKPVATVEDPRQVITKHHPLTDQVIAALKLYRDHDKNQDVAYVYMPGEVYVARKDAPPEGSGAHVRHFDARSWDWDVEASGPLPSGFGDVIPVIRFHNRDGVAEFERHIDVLDRINRTVLRGMVIMTFQAFRQRAVKGDLPERDQQGNLIDYDEVLRSGPDAMWLLPPDVELWESGQVDMAPLMNFIKQDVLFLAAVTRTPLSMLTPDAASQSAEGASLQREGLVFKTEDRINRASQSWSHVLALIFRFLGDADRSKPETIQLMWAPVERYSVSERANAIAQTKGVLSRYQQLTEIWGMSPAQANRALSELTDDLVLDQQFAKAAAPPAAPTAPVAALPAAPAA